MYYICKKYLACSLDENNNCRIDAGIIEDTLQNITDNGAETTNALTMGGLTVIGTSTILGNFVVMNDLQINGKLETSTLCLQDICKNEWLRTLITYRIPYIVVYDYFYPRATDIDPYIRDGKYPYPCITLIDIINKIWY